MTVRRSIINLFIALAVAAVPLQIVIDSSAANVASACIVLVSSLSVLLYAGWSRALEDRPLSTFAVFGFCMTTQLGALLAQTAAWTPLRSSLYDPLYTFGTLAFYQAIALTAHALYRFFSVKKPNDARLVRGVLGWAGIYLTPSAGALWFMGCIGLVTFFFSRNEGVIGKIAGAFNFLAWAPFLILVYLRDVGESYCNGRVNRVLLTIYALIAGVLGLALNTRAVMFSGVFTLVLITLLAAMRSDAPLRKGPILKLCALGAVLIAVSGPISDLATSMVIARQWRGKVSPTAMIRTTFDVWRNPGLIAAYKAEGETASRYKAYDEHYIENPLLARLIETKFHDNAFHFARAISTEQAKARLRDISAKLVWAGLPTPILRKLNVGVNKDDLAYSMGDYLAYLSRGMPLGGRKVGSMFAQGIALFGPLFPFLYALMCFALFALMDLLSIPALAGAATISALGMLEIFSFFGQGLSYEGLHDVVYLFVRNFAQKVLIYAFLFGMARLMLPTKPHRPAAAKLTAWQPSR